MLEYGMDSHTIEL